MMSDSKVIYIVPRGHCINHSHALHPLPNSVPIAALMPRAGWIEVVMAYFSAILLSDTNLVAPFEGSIAGTLEGKPY